ncbi:hypothetical protein ACJX0J_023257, partial [Zea mays]
RLHVKHVADIFFILFGIGVFTHIHLYAFAICELGSTIGAVEEVDINSLNSKEIVGMMTLRYEDSGKDVLKDLKVTLITKKLVIFHHNLTAGSSRDFKCLGTLARSCYNICFQKSEMCFHNKASDCLILLFFLAGPLWMTIADVGKVLPDLND